MPTNLPAIADLLTAASAGQVRTYFTTVAAHLAEIDAQMKAVTGKSLWSDLPRGTLEGVFSGLAANKHFIGNAAGDGAEWAVPYKAGYFTRDMSTASGTQVITGLGFMPSLIIFFGASDGSGAGQASFGYAAGAVQNAIFYRLSDKTWTLRENVCAEYDTNGTDIYTGKVNSYDTDGFTIGWTKYASKVGNAYTNWIAFR